MRLFFLYLCNIMKIGNIDFNVEALSEMTEQQFRETYRGKLSVDMDQTVKELSKYFKKDVQEVKKVSRKRKKSKSEDSF